MRHHASLHNYGLATLLLLTFVGFLVLDLHAQEPGAITGTVTDEAANPLADIVVRAEVLDTQNNEQWNEAGVTQTDETGQYTLCCLSADEYRISFLDAGAEYITEYYDDVLPPEVFGPDTVSMVQVTAALTTTAINAQLAKYSTLIGTVTDHTAAPIEQIGVELYRYDRIGGDWKQLETAQTNTDGEYRSKVLPGRYRLYFYDMRTLPDYISEYYEDEVTFDAAKEVTVTKEINIVIDATLRPQSRITGTLTNRSGEPASGVTVVLYEFDEEFGWTPSLETESNDAGCYVMDDLLGGVYRLYFTDRDSNRLYDSEFYNDVNSIVDAADITVSPGETVQNIDAELADLSQIQGTVTTESNEPLPAIGVIALRYTDTGTGTPFWQEVESTQTNGSGDYTLTGLQSGLYQLIFHDINDAYQSEWYDNSGYEATATAITLAPETTLTGMNAQLAAKPFTWPPIAIPDSITLREGGTVTRTTEGTPSVLTNDLRELGEELQAQTISLPQHGTLQFQTNGKFTYKHDGSETTTDFFTYRASDGVKESNTATVTLTIEPINDAPQATDDTVVVVQGQSATTLSDGRSSLLANDSDVDSDTLTAVVLMNPSHGTLTVQSNGTFTYKHNGDTATSDSFVYQAQDSAGATADATVQITVEPAPIAQPSLSFQKTVAIEGITPTCTATTTMKVPLGTTIVYCYTIRNTGEEMLTTHSLIDSHLGKLLDNMSYDLAPGATYSTTFTQTLTVTTTNIATWTASTALGAFNRLEPLSTSIQEAATIEIAGPTDDADGDTIPDNVEGAGDPDHDNIPNFRDVDADNDNVMDRDEVGNDPTKPIDSNSDGTPDYLDNSTQPPTTFSLWLPVVQR